MPKRCAIALALTALALVLLLNFQTPAEVTPAADTRGATGFVAGGTTPGTTINPGGGTAVDPGAQGGGTSTTPGGTQGNGTLGGGTSTTPGGTQGNGTQGGGSTTSATLTGPIVDTRFGPVQVQVSVANGQLVDITALQLPDGDRRSASISSRVEPMLRSQALEAQNAQIDG